MQIPYTVEARPDTGLYNAKLGVWLFLASEVMLFGALFSSLILLRTGAAEWPHGYDILTRKKLGPGDINFHNMDLRYTLRCREAPPEAAG